MPGHADIFCRPTAVMNKIIVYRIYTVEPPNKGQVGTSTDVHYSKIVLYWGVVVKEPPIADLLPGPCYNGWYKLFVLPESL